MNTRKPHGSVYAQVWNKLVWTGKHLDLTATHLEKMGLNALLKKLRGPWEHLRSLRVTPLNLYGPVLEEDGQGA